MANAFLMFLIGMYAVRKGILRDPRTHRDTLLIVIVFGLIVLAFGTDLLPLPALQMANLRVQWAYRSLLYRMLNEEFLGLAYAAALVLLVTYTAMGRRIGAILAYPGR